MPICVAELQPHHLGGLSKLPAALNSHSHVLCEQGSCTCCLLQIHDDLLELLAASCLVVACQQGQIGDAHHLQQNLERITGLQVGLAFFPELTTALPVSKCRHYLPTR